MLPVLTCSKGVLFHDATKILNASAHTSEIKKGGGNDQMLTNEGRRQQSTLTRKQERM